MSELIVIAEASPDSLDGLRDLPQLREGFDAAFYVRVYARRLIGGDADPFTHYLTNVRGDRLDPSPDFSEAFYLDQYPDVLEGVGDGRFYCGFHHYVVVGKEEGRTPRRPNLAQIFEPRSVSTTENLPSAFEPSERIIGPQTFVLAPKSGQLAHSDLATTALEFHPTGAMEATVVHAGDYVPDGRTGVNEISLSADVIDRPNSKRSAKIARLDDGGSVGLSIDRVVSGSSFAIVTGWFFGATQVKFFDADSGIEVPPQQFSLFPRHDVATAYDQRPERVHGFLAIWNECASAQLQATVPIENGNLLAISAVLDENLSESELDVLLEECRAFAGLFLKCLNRVPNVLAKLIPNIALLTSDYPFARGFIEMAKGVPGIGGLVVGWLVCEPDVEVFLIDQNGNLEDLRNAARWNRQDVIDAMGGDFGNYAQNGGVLQSWRHDFQIGDEIKVIAVVGDRAFVLSSARWAAAPVEPVGFARWAFSYPTPRDKFFERLTLHDGDLLRALIVRANARRPNNKPRILSFGSQPKRPVCTIIVPLYQRYDFMLNQFIEFERDDYLRKNAEIVFVIDDPNLVAPVEGESARFYKTYGVPFRTIWAGQNRGFAGANNVGVAHSSAPYLLLMNSDVIPTQPGWLKEMMTTIEADSEIGVLGVRLHFPNGAIQHDGMAFRWEPAWDAYLNKHPGAGLRLPVEKNQPVSRPAVTAACALLTRNDYISVGGLDETFLIGDFEDSDLCLKIRSHGKKIVCLQTINSLVHLERQSFSAIGTPGFRDFVARYNAWQHQTRWGSVIPTLPPY